MSVMVSESGNIKVRKHARCLSGWFYTILPLTSSPEYIYIYIFFFFFSLLMTASSFKA